MARLEALHLADDPAAWQALGLSLADGACRVGEVALRMGRPGTGGIVAWELAEVEAADLDGLPVAAPEPPAGAAEHPGGVVGLDHVVVLTPDRARTEAALAAAGIRRRRTRHAGERRQDFYVLDTAVLEVVGPAEPEPGGGPAAFWGIALVARDLDALAARLGDRLTPVRDAVQPGRRIAALRATPGIGTRVAFMTPRGEPAQARASNR